VGFAYHRISYDTQRLSAHEKLIKGNNAETILITVFRTSLKHSTKLEKFK